MSKPGFFFYMGDWLKDTKGLSLEARGAWIDLLCALYEAGGTVTWPLQAFEHYWSTVDRNGVVYSARDILDELRELNICDISTDPNGKITVTCRRMVREIISKENNRKRQERHRTKKKVTPESQENTAPLPSPSLNPSLFNLNLKSPAAAGLFVDKSLDKIQSLHKQTEADQLVNLAVEIGGRNPEVTQKLCQWTISMVRSQKGEPSDRVTAVTRACLENVRQKLKDGYEIKSLWALLEIIFTRERTKYMQGPENERHKRGPIAAPVREILKGIGNG